MELMLLCCDLMRTHWKRVSKYRFEEEELRPIRGNMRHCRAIIGRRDRRYKEKDLREK